MPREATEGARDMVNPDRTVPDTLFATLDGIAVPAFVIDRLPDGRFAFAHVNTCHERTVGLRCSDLRGHALAEVLPARLTQSVSFNYVVCLSREAPVSYDEVLDLGGRERCWRTTLSRADGPFGAGTRIVGMSVEITDLKDREVVQTTELALLADQRDELRAFAGLTAHDMRGPLANMVNLTEIILDGFVDMGDDKADMIAMCGDVARRSLESIDEIMAQVERKGSGSGIERETSLDRICRDLSALIDPTNRVRISYPAMRLCTDDVVLQLALRNILENASRFCRSAIDIVASEDRSRDCIAVTVTDDGPGIPAGEDPVRSAAEGAPVRADGRGFGIRTVLKLLRSRGGDLAFERPTPDGGARFRITLPGRILHGDPA